MATVTIYHDDSSTETIDETVGWRYTREIGALWKMRITVARDDAQAVSLTKRQDEVELSTADRGVLTDIETGGSTWTLVVYSPEWYAQQYEPTAGGDLRSGDDNALLTTLIGSVSEWSEGTIADLTGSMDFVFNHAFANEAMRKIEKNVPGELDWAGDGTVTYADRLGSDKSASITLSPANANIDGELKVTETGKKLDATHLRVIGAHEGEAQKFATLVPSDDSASYDNKVTYTTSRWSSGDTKNWARWENKDALSQDTIEEEAAALGEDLGEEYIELKGTVVGEDIALGDTVHVTKAEADIDRDMRIHRLTTRTRDETPAATVDDVLLSTRTIARSDPTEDLRDIQRFNTAFQGSSVWGTLSGGRQPVNSSLNYELPVFYPDLEFEHLSELLVRGLPYRAYSSGAASGGDHTHTVSIPHPSHSHDVPISTTSGNNTEFNNVVDVLLTITGEQGNGDWKTAATFEPLVDTSFVFCFANIRPNAADTFATRINTASDEYPNSTGVIHNVDVADDNTASWIVIAENTSGQTLDFQIDTTNGVDYFGEVQWYAVGLHTHDIDDTQTSNDALGTTVDETSDASGGHTHPVDPGIQEFGTDTPTAVDVIVNGTTVSTDIGTGEFETTVDITGDLNKGQWNMIELSSDDLGHLDVSFSSLAYRQIGTN